MDNEDYTLTTADLSRLLSVGGSAVNGTAKAGWEIDALELGKAREFLNLKLVVMLRFTSGRVTAGTHRVRWSSKSGVLTQWHHITLSQIWTKECANDHLWHELAHAWQAERWSEQTGKPAYRFHHDTKEKGVSYENDKWEIHANKVAAEQRGWSLLR